MNISEHTISITIILLEFIILILSVTKHIIDYKTKDEEKKNNIDIIFNWHNALNIEIQKLINIGQYINTKVNDNKLFGDVNQIRESLEIYERRMTLLLDAGIISWTQSLWFLRYHYDPLNKIIISYFIRKIGKEKPRDYKSIRKTAIEVLQYYNSIN